MDTFSLLAAAAALYILYHVIGLAGAFVSRKCWIGSTWRYYGLIAAFSIIVGGTAAALLGMLASAHDLRVFGLYALLIGLAVMLACDRRHCEPRPKVRP